MFLDTIEYINPSINIPCMKSTGKNMAEAMAMMTSKELFMFIND
jgi:hypothetical protein